MRNKPVAWAAPLLALACGGLGAVLQNWSFANVDDKGLLLRGHISQTLVWLLTAAVIALVYCFARLLRHTPRYTDSFPPSLLSGMGCVLGAVGVLFAGGKLYLQHGDDLTVTTALAGLLAGAALLRAGWCRFRGRQGTVLLHGAVCLFYLLLLICQYRQWSAEPQLQLYAFQLLATVFLMVGTFQRAGFDGDMGNRKSYVFFRLVGIFFCVTAIPGSDIWAAYLYAAVWSATDLCDLTPGPAEGR